MLELTDPIKQKESDESPIPVSCTGLFSHRALLLALTLLVVATFANSLNGDYVYDDHRVVQANPLLGHWDRLTLTHIFTRDYWGAYNTSEGEQPNESLYYRPIVHFLEMATYEVAGQKAVLWHVVSILLHLVATLLAFFIANQSLAAITSLEKEKRRLMSTFAAAMFAIHPAQSEVVAWISAASTSLVAVLIFGAFLCYLKYRGTGRRRYLATGILLYASALLTKETAIGLSIIVVTYELFVFGRTQNLAERVRSSLRMALPFVSVMGIYFVIRHAILHILFGEVRSLNFPEDASLTLVDNLRTLPALLMGYLKLAISPYNHSLMYDFNYVHSLDARSFWLPVSILFLAMTALAYFWRRIPEVRVAAIWMVIPLLPHLNTRGFLSEEIMHDRYLYKSMLGFGMMLVILLVKAGQSQRWRLSGSRIAIASLLILFALCMQTVIQNTHWQNDQTVWNWSSRYAPNSRIVHISLGMLAEKNGRLQEAFQEYDKALRINTDTLDALNNEAFVYARVGNWGKATRNFEHIVALTPNKALAHFNLSFTYAMQKDYTAAAREQKKAIELDPDGVRATEWRLNLSQLERLVAAHKGEEKYSQ
ncbi:MAG TPA: tetratricopeptide repeat protein [Terriglobales bacterium]|jgi:tetratricopeptide (TPR) repeat protein